MSAAYNLKAINLVDVLTQYKDICATIEYYEIILDDIERDYQRTRKVLIGGPKAKPSHSPIEKQYDGTKETISRYKEIEEVLEKKRALKKRADEVLKKFEGIEFQVAYKKYVEGKTLKETALELGYAHGYVKNISKRITESLGEL